MDSALYIAVLQKKKDVSNANQVVLRACANLVLKHGGLAQLKSGECDQYN